MNWWKIAGEDRKIGHFFIELRLALKNGYTLRIIRSMKKLRGTMCCAFLLQTWRRLNFDPHTYMYSEMLLDKCLRKWFIKIMNRRANEGSLHFLSAFLCPYCNRTTVGFQFSASKLILLATNYNLIFHWPSVFDL